jgi:16S rRNA (uracil1498-N3)-methyltransferase
MTGFIQLPRLYTPPEILPPGGRETLCPMPAEQARYLGTVLRRTAGDTVRLFNAQAGEWLASIADIRKDKGHFRLERPLRSASTQPALTLAFALLKRDATDLVLRMGTELGVTRFLPLITERTNSHRVNLERLHAIATEAAEQCERLDIPEICAPDPLAALIGAWPAGRTLFVAMERMDATSARTLADAREADGLLIGPEGGWSEAERQMLAKRAFVAPVSLGSLVLRADTAVAAGLALMGDGLRSGTVLSQ